jgi:hypothetical protein
MRIGALVLVVGIFSAVVGVVGACTATTSADLVCQSAGGVCILSTDLVGCADELQGSPCDTGYTCCTPLADGSTPAPTPDAGTKHD